VTVITAGADCSITSTAAVSTIGATGCFTFRAAFFTAACLGLALATVRFVAFFAALATLRSLPRLAEFPLRSFARFCTFDAFLRLAMIDPLVLRHDTRSKSQRAVQPRVITRFQLEREVARQCLNHAASLHLELWITSRKNFHRSQEHTSDQNAERDVVETVGENVHDSRPITAELIPPSPQQCDGMP
jgi:hypothetical protein